MEESKIVLMRLYGGEIVIGKEMPQTNLSSWSPIGVNLEDPRLVMMVPTMRGDVHVAIKPVCAPFTVKRLEKNLTVPFTQIMYTLTEDEIEKELVGGYKSEISGIKIATGGDVAVVNSTKGQGGEFTL